MKDRDEFELELKEALNNSPDWKGSKENMWKNIEENLHEKNKPLLFRNKRIVSGALAAVLLCAVFLGKNIFMRYLFMADLFRFTEKKHSAMITAKENGPAPIYLRWDFNFNFKDEACMPGQDTKLDINLTAVREDIKITEDVPSIIITRIGTTDHDEKINEIPVPQLKGQVIKKGENVNITLNFKAPNEPGLYIASFSEVKFQHEEGTSGLSGGGARFTVLAQKSEVYIKNMNVNKEINVHGNIIKVRDIVMNDKETTVNYTITYAQRHADCFFKLITDTGKSLYEIGWMGRDIQNGMDASVNFNPVPKTAQKVVLEISNLNETTADGVKEIEGDWKIDIPIN